jgi:hypothetical protein
MSKFIPSTWHDHQPSDYGGGRYTRSAAMHYYPKDLYGTGVRRSAQCLPQEQAGVQAQLGYGGDDYGASMGWAWKLDSVNAAVPGGKEIYQSARDQLVLAKAQTPLVASGLRAAHLSLDYKLTHTPVDVLAAKLMGSTALSLASRIIVSPAHKAELLHRAKELYDEGSCNMCMVWDSTDDIVAINQSTVSTLKAFNGTGEQSLNWLIGVMGGGWEKSGGAGGKTDPRSVDLAKKHAFEGSGAGIIAGTVEESAKDAGELAHSAAERTKSLITGECPADWGDFECWWKTTGTKWAMGIGVVAVGAGVLMWLGRPYLEAAQRVLPEGEK